MKKVLIVEDNRLERKIVHHLLELNFGKDLYIDDVADGNQALDYLRKQKYDLVITDLIMPKTEGIELIRNLHQNHPSVKIIAVSGSNPYYLYMAKKIGIDGMFTKPLNKEPFLSKINHLLQLKPVSIAGS